jgi:hypothetical protein
VFEAEGVWDGVSEASVVVEIIASGIEAEKVYALANVIKAINKQQAVLVTVQDVESTLV